MFPIEAVQGALHHICAHYALPLTGESLAGIAGYSPFHFHRLFRHVTQAGVADFVREVRLRHAALRLRDTQETVLDISLACGFASLPTFNQAFKRRFSMPPPAYRRLGTPLPLIAPDAVLKRYYRRLGQKGDAMLTPYPVQRGPIRLLGRSATVRHEAESGAAIGSLYASMDKIFSRIPNPVDDRFYGLTYGYGSHGPGSRMTYWLCKEVETYWQPGEAGIPAPLGDDMEAIVLPATRWLYIPVRYDDPFVLSLAPPALHDDPGSLTPYAFGWARLWLKENGLAPQDYPFELEIYGLHTGYEGIEGGAIKNPHGF